MVLGGRSNPSVIRTRGYGMSLQMAVMAGQNCAAHWRRTAVVQSRLLSALTQQRALKLFPDAGWWNVPSQWLRHCRRLAKDWEKSILSAESWLLIAHIRLVTRKLAR